MVPRVHIEAVREVMESLGYLAPTACEGELLFCQFQMKSRSATGRETTPGRPCLGSGLL